MSTRREKEKRSRPPVRDGDSWDDYFTDMDSDSRPAPRRKETPRGNPQSKRRPASRSPAEGPGRRPAQSRRPAPDGRSPSGKASAKAAKRSPSGSRRPPQQKRRPKRRMSRRARAVVTVLSLLVMVAVAILLCVFLLFKVGEIEVTGDSPYTNEDIIRICGVKKGDNLYFLSKKEIAETLQTELPYIERAEIVQKIPSTLEIEVTAAKVAACFKDGDSYLYISESNKILERNAAKKEGVMEIAGLKVENPTPGKPLTFQAESKSAESGSSLTSTETSAVSALSEDEMARSACDEILKVIAELGVTDKFTRLDLSDVHNISLFYEGRIEFKLGNAAGLADKIKFGVDNVRESGKIGEQERGVLDLTLYKDVKKAYFTEDSGVKSSDVSGNPDTSAPSDVSGSSGDSIDSQSSDEPENDYGIPDTPFTGNDGGDGADNGYSDE